MPDRSGWDRKPGFSLAGKKAVVIGAYSERVTGVLSAFMEAGAAVASITVADAGTRGRLTTDQPNPHVYNDLWDVRDPANVSAGYERMVAQFGTPDILVTAQDERQLGLIEDTTDDTYRRTMAVIVDGTYYACRAFLKALPSGTPGRIICITTMFGERGIDGMSAYAAAHGAVHNLVRALSQEAGARGVTVNAIATGWMTDTPGRGPDEIGENRLMRFVPMRRFGSPGEVGPLAVLLAGEAGGNISGQILHVDGGITTHL